MSRPSEGRVEELKQNQGQEQGREEARSGRSTSAMEHNHEQFTQWSLEQD